MDESGQSGKKTLRVEGRGCVFVRQVVCGYPPETKARVSYKGVHQIGGTPNRTTALAFAFLVAAALVTAQDVKQAAILIGGKSNPIRFVTFDKEVYISWADLLRLMPSVFSVSSKGEIVVSPFTTDPLAVLEALNRASDRIAPPGKAIESQIDGDFEGWDGETIFKLTNGQIWQQDEYAYTYEYDFMPDVIIYPDGPFWKMKVEGVSDVIRVKRLK